MDLFSAFARSRAEVPAASMSSPATEEGDAIIPAEEEDDEGEYDDDDDDDDDGEEDECDDGDGDEEEPPEDVPGVVYIARVPPYMGPSSLRDVLGQLGAVVRIYLEPEDERRRRERRRSGGCSKRKFARGWAEFRSARAARDAALALNGRPLGALVRRKSHFREDVMAVRYLPGFSWENLVAEKREARLDRSRAIRDG